MSTRLPIQSPIIVTGMAFSGTTLLSEMVHGGGIPMYEKNLNPDYDHGVKSERQLTQQINLEILGTDKIRAVNAIYLEQKKEISQSSLSRLSREMGTGPWGFKDPRTTLTYREWRRLFPEGVSLYTYRHHHEVLRHYVKSPNRPMQTLRRIRKALRAWITYNSQILQNIQLDIDCKRPFALVSYEELMQNKSAVASIEKATGLTLYDARKPDLRRHKKNVSPQNWVKICIATAETGHRRKIASLYSKLEKLRVRS